MLRALDEYAIGGIKTNIGLFRRILLDADFRAARIDTGYLERLLAGAASVEEAEIPEDVVAIAAALLTTAAERPLASTSAMENTSVSKWAAAGRQEGLRA
jgi:acetyl-CoA carboxylase biotin carboxylase subunit